MINETLESVLAIRFAGNARDDRAAFDRIDAFVLAAAKVGKIEDAMAASWHAEAGMGERSSEADMRAHCESLAG